MAEGLAPGWYTNDEGERRYWTGESWVTPEAETPTEGTDESASESALPPIEDAQPTNSKPRSKKPVIITSVSVLALALIGAGFFWFESRASTESLAIEACEAQLLNTLKAPSTAVLHDSEVLDYSSHLMDSWFAYKAEGREKIDFDEALRTSVDIAAEQKKNEPMEGSATRIVAGSVDAENGFGATERSDWRCFTIVDTDTMEVPTFATIIEFGDDLSLLDGLDAMTS